jgi:hypothetical protein
MTIILEEYNIKDSMDIDKLSNFVLPKLSHDDPEAFAELVDNSLDAGASKVDVIFNSSSIIICDNGSGMNLDEVKNSCAFSSKTSSKSLIGAFGCGGTTASSYLANYKKIITKKEDGELLVVGQNLKENVASLQRLEPSEQDFLTFNNFCGDTGTYIELSNLKQSRYSRVGNRVNAIESHFSEIFRKMIDKGRIINVHYNSNVTKINSYDPLFFGDSEKTIQQLQRERVINYAGYEIKIKMSALNPSSFSNGEKNGPTQFKQGVYFVRGDRQIQHRSEVDKLWKNHPELNSARVEIEFPTSLDEDFGVSMSKNKVILIEKIITELANEIAPWYRSVKTYFLSQRSLSSNDELKKEVDNFKKSIVENAGSIGVPEKKNFSDGNKVPKKDGDKKGTIEKKGTQITRRQAKESLDIPDFIFVQDSVNPRPYWFDYDNGSITINTLTTFVKSYLVDGEKNVKEFFQNLLISQYFVMKSYIVDTEEERAVQEFIEKQAEQMNRVFKFTR